MGSTETAGEARFEALAGLADGIAAPDERERAGHRERVCGAMQAQNVAALVVEPGPAMLYLSGVRWGRSERPFLMVLHRDGAVAWVVPGFEERKAREQLGSQATVAAWEEHQDPMAAAAELLPEGSEAVAVDGDTRSFIVNRLRDAARERPVIGASSVLDAVRMRKTAPELARLRRANEITKIAIASAAQHVEPGMRQSEIAALMTRAQEAAGLVDVWCLALVGPAAAFPHGTSEDRALAKDDLVLVDTGGGLHGYRSDITRTWPVGNPGDEPRRAWEAVRAAQSAAMEVIAPGRACGEADATARAVLEKAGFGTDYERFTHRLGHGIGLQVHEHPYLVRDNALRLEPGMTMSNEPGIYVPGSYGVRIEDIVAVTEDGVERFGPPIGPWDDPFAGHTV